MLPSRGIVRTLPSGGVQRSLFSRLSSTSRTAHGRQFGTSLRSTGAPSPLRARYVVAPIALGGISSFRNLSLWGYGSSKAEPPKPEPTPEVSAPAPPAPEAVSPPVEPMNVAPTEFDFSSLVNEQDVLNMPEQIGYLHAIGLDYGWGVTSSMQWLLEHVHVWSGMDWALSIAATAALFRLAFTIPYIKSLQFQHKMARVKADPRHTEAMEIMKNAYKNPAATNGQQEIMRGRFLNNMVMKEYGASNYQMLWGLLPIPFSIGLFRLISGMTAIPVPGLENTNFLWLHTLTQTDPYFILPAVSAALVFVTTRLTSKHSPVQSATFDKMAYVMTVFMFGVTAFLSAALNIMGISIGATMVLQTWILNIPTIRRSLGLAEQKKPEPPKRMKYEAPRANTSGIEGLKAQINDSWAEMKKGANESIANATGMYGSSESDKAEKRRLEELKKAEDARKKHEREEFDRKYGRGGR